MTKPDLPASLGEALWAGMATFLATLWPREFRVVGHSMASREAVIRQQ